MYIGFHSFTRQLNKNRLFLDPNLPIGDNAIYPFVLLAQRLKEQGHKVATIDTDKLDNFDSVVFIEFPGVKNKYFKDLIKKNTKNLYLLAYESPVIKPDNFDIKNHIYFKKIFTWADNFVDNPPPSLDRNGTSDGQRKKYFKINYSYEIPKNLDFNINQKEKLCAVIASNKFTPHKDELYSERIRAIRWFEKNHPEDFDLFGMGWDRYSFYGEFLGFKMARFNRLKFLTKLLAPHYPSYKGSVKSKKETYKNYKFSICYENAKDFPGYITEKIFDCFFAGCVPIYLGASNVSQHIPPECFIDKRNFQIYEELYEYIKNMPAEKYKNYLDAIKNFLKSDKAYQFSADYFVNTLIKEITT